MELAAESDCSAVDLRDKIRVTLKSDAKGVQHNLFFSPHHPTSPVSLWEFSNSPSLFVGTDGFIYWHFGFCIYWYVHYCNLWFFPQGENFRDDGNVENHLVPFPLFRRISRGPKLLGGLSEACIVSQNQDCCSISCLSQSDQLQKSSLSSFIYENFQLVGIKIGGAEMRDLWSRKV